MNAARANGLYPPPVVIGYAPIFVVRDAPLHSDFTVISCVKAITVGATLLPPALGAIGVAILLFLGNY